MLELEKNINKILVIAAHPDDEILGCGGSIHKWTQQGKIVHALILAEGVTSRRNERDPGLDKEQIEHLHKSVEKAHKVVGTKSYSLLDFPDNRMDSVDLIDVVKSIENAISTIQPDTVITHHPYDLNVDHRIIQQAVLTACRPQPNSTVQSILFFEVPSATDWQIQGPQNQFYPQLYVDISGSLESKLKSLEAYSSEMRDWPHSRSIAHAEILAKHRGATVGLSAAEAFSVGRIIIK